MPSSLPSPPDCVRAALAKAGLSLSYATPCRVLDFPDGGTVFVEEFREYDDVPFVLATDGSTWRMLPSKETSFGYTLVEDNSSSSTDAMFKGSSITEAEAVSLLPSPVEP